MRLSNITAACLLLLSIHASAQKPKLALQKGDQYAVSADVKMTTTVDAGGHEIETLIKVSFIDNVKVVDTKNDQYEFVSTITSMNMKVTLMGKETVLNSDEMSEEQLSKTKMAALINKPRSVTTDKNGKIIREDTLMKRTMEELIGGSSPSAVSIIDKRLLDRDLRPGNIWIDSTVQPVAKIVNRTNTTFTVKSREANAITIGFEGNVKQAGVVEQGGNEIDIEGDTNISGETVMNDKGIIMSSNLTSSGIVAVTVGESPMQSKVVMKMTTNAKKVE